MIIKFDKSDKKITYGTKTISAWNKVRRIAEGTRTKHKSSEVVKTEPVKGEPKPYDPQYFPNGAWKITGIVPHPDKKNDSYLYPFFIATDAHQPVKIWTVEKDGSYGVETAEVQEDSGYGIHFSSSSTTLGCIRIELEKDLLDLVAAIKTALAKKEAIQIVVSA